MYDIKNLRHCFHTFPVSAKELRHITNNKKKRIKDRVYDEPDLGFDPIDSSSRQELTHSLRQEVKNSLRHEVRHSLRQEVKHSLRQDVKHALRQQVKHSLRPEVKHSLQPEVKHSSKPEVRRTRNRGAEIVLFSSCDKNTAKCYDDGRVQVIIV
jgi:hypothetical protein